MSSPDGARHRISLRARWLLTMAGPPLEGGWVRIEAGRITGIGRGDPPGPPDEQTDLGEAILIPGLVNAHTHLEFSQFDSPLEAEGGLPGWIRRVVAARSRRRAAAQAGSAAAAAIRQGLAECAAAGVTTIGEIATDLPDGAHRGPGPAVRIFCEGLGLRDQAADAVPPAIAARLDRLDRTGIAGGISPHAPYSVSAALGRRLVAQAVRRGLPLAMHLCESREEEELLAAGTGPFRQLLDDLGAWDGDHPPRLLSPVDWIGLLAGARRSIVVHATHIGHDPPALARLARHRDRLAVVVCPRTTRRLSATHPPIALLREAGLRVAVGTDSRGSNPDLSLLAECRTLVDAGLASPRESLQMATVNAAWALALEHRAGLLAVGRPADLAILEPSTASTDPFLAAIVPDTLVRATFRRGRLIAGSLIGSQASIDSQTLPAGMPTPSPPAMHSDLLP